MAGAVFSDIVEVTFGAVASKFGLTFVYEKSHTIVLSGAHANIQLVWDELRDGEINLWIRPHLLGAEENFSIWEIAALESGSGQGLTNGTFALDQPSLHYELKKLAELTEAFAGGVFEGDKRTLAHLTALRSLSAALNTILSNGKSYIGRVKMALNEGDLDRASVAAEQALVALNSHW